MDNLQIQYPSYYIVFCILAGLALAALLYYKSNYFRDQSKKLSLPLGTLRFLGVTGISLLLLAPILKRLFTETKRPIIVIAQDNSESLQSSYKQEELSSLNNNIEDLKNALNTNYDVKHLEFGAAVNESPTLDYSDKVTNISNAFDYIYDNYSDQNLGAVIITTDGIYNEGSNPVYTSAKLDAPVYTVALGDTTIKRDLKIKRIFNNQIAYLGDQFEAEIDIAAYNCTAQRPRLTVSKFENGAWKKLQEESFLIDANDFFTTKVITLDADQAGVQRFKVTLSSIKDEVTFVNNSQEIFVDVLDARQKILLLANAPHPDLTALKSAFETNKNYEIEVAYAKAPPTTWVDYDLVVLHQLPSKTNAITNSISQIKQLKIPTWYIVGTQSDLNAVSRTQNLVDITGQGANTNEVSAIVNQSFTLFTLDETLANALPTFAPLTAPFGEFIGDATAQTLLQQRIGKVETKYPLLLFGEDDGRKQAILNAEGLWKWKLYDFLQHQNHELFNNMIRKTAQYLTVKEDKRRFQINTAKKIFKENERITLDAILYNQSYELINDPDAKLALKNSAGDEFNYVFSKKEKSYFLDAGYLPIGNYTYTGSTNYAGQAFDHQGQFSIQPIQKERSETTANHGLLTQLSQQFGGAMIYPDDITSLASMIESSGNVKPVMYQSTETKSIINLRWIFFLLFAFLAIEWFLRRYFGSY